MTTFSGDLSSHLELVLTANEKDHPNTHSPITPHYISVLENQGNYCNDWGQVYIPLAADEGSFRRIRNCTFCGVLYLGTFDGNVKLDTQAVVPSGLFGSVFCGYCYLSDNCFVANCGSVSNVFVGSNAVLVQCANISGPESGIYTSFGDGVDITVGPESSTDGSSRKIYLGSSATYGNVCCQVLGHGSLGKVHRHSPKSSLTIICDNSVLVSSDVSCSFVASAATIKRSVVTSSTLLAANLTSDCHISVADSRVSGCIVHDHCSVENNAQLEQVLMFAHSACGSSCHVSQSVLASDASIAHGECARSVLGPFVGFHHTSLLLATCWVLGRGNIGYGAMIGANHTGRSNDQECLLGEGCFVGLNTALKFPFDTLYSPYTIIAAASVCLPQKIAAPFSLVCSQESPTLCPAPASGIRDGEAVSPALNSLKPGWILWGNQYFLEKSMCKFHKRRQSTQYRTDFPIFRPTLVAMVLATRSDLRELHMQHPSVFESDSPLVFTERHLSGIGKCTLQVGDAKKAIAAYTDFVRRYALHGLLHLLCCSSNTEAITHKLTIPCHLMDHATLSHIAEDVCAMEQHHVKLAHHSRSHSEVSEDEDAHHALSRALHGTALLTDSHVEQVLHHQISVLQLEFPALLRAKDLAFPDLFPVLAELLDGLVHLENAYARGVRSSKQKDIARAGAVITDYNDRVNHFLSNDSSGGAVSSEVSAEDVQSLLSLDATIQSAEARAKHIKEVVEAINKHYA